MQHDFKKYEIARLIFKSISYTISKEEQEILNSWLKLEENQKLYNRIIDKKLIKKKYLQYQKIDADKIYKKLERQILEEKGANNSHIRKLFRVFKYAATIVLFLGIGYFYQQGYFNSNEKLVIPNESITIQRDNGKLEILKEVGVSEITDSEGNIIGIQNGLQLVYNKEIKKESLLYNTITVPYGKHFEVLFSDGSSVKLNAGTSLRFPVKFIEGAPREVFLDGEAFFEVAKDNNHPFLVNSEYFTTRVYGTKFNVSSYQEDDFINTALLEGSVGVYNNKNEFNKKDVVFVKPNQMAEWDKNDESILVKDVDIDLHIAWINNRVVFKHLPFIKIIPKLERHYNVTIINNNQKLNDEFFTSSFDVETIEEVLEAFNKTFGIEYIIKNNQILIN